MLDLKEFAFKRFIEPMQLPEDAQARVRIAYGHLDNFMEHSALMAYITTAPTALRIGSDLKEVVGWITKQAREIGTIDEVKQVEAMTVLTTFNRMGGPYWRFRRDHIEYELPYAEFVTCRWYLEAVRLLRDFDPQDYPLVESWEEFFLVLPQTIRHEGPGKLELKFKDYRDFAMYGKFSHWYAENKAMSPGYKFKEEYVGELTVLSDAELLEELSKMNWGMKLVKAEIQRRKETR